MEAVYRPGGCVSGVMVLLGLLAGGCAGLTHLSEEGGLIGRALSRSESSDLGASPADSSGTLGDLRSEPGIPVPYRPADFQEHAADGEFTWHWTATRTGDRVEVKGLIENRQAGAVQGVTFALSSPAALVRGDAPGLIRPGQMRPFYFAVAFPGDEQQARLSVVAVDRTPVGSETRTAAVLLPRRDGPVPAHSTAAPFTDHARDHFFSLHWNTMKKGGEIEVSGLVENRDGPMFEAVTLLVSASGAAGNLLKARRLVLWGPFDKKEARPFAVTLPVAVQAERVSVIVASYQFFHPAGGD